MQPYPHTFTSKLKAKNCVEHDDVTFEIDTEASDAEVICIFLLYVYHTCFLAPVYNMKRGPQDLEL